MSNFSRNSKIVSYIEGSDLFKNCRAAWDAFVASEPNCSFGNNNITLVHASYIHSILDGLDGEDDEEGVLASQIQNVLDRIKFTKKLPGGGELEDFYVDLEN